jgi:hypothetical protein
MKARRAIVLAAVALLVAAMARGGHELPVYPSYYPHEIEIRTIAPKAAADLLRAGKLHAYVGSAPDFAGAVPNTMNVAESLGSFIVVRLEAESPLAQDEASACGAAETIVRDMAARAGGGAFTAHPYPVTPRHGDFLHHADRADDMRRRILGSRAPPQHAAIRVHAGSALARSLVRAEWVAEGPPFDATVEEIDVSGLVADATTALNGWLGPRWVRSGWFHAFRMLGDSPRDPAAAEKARADVARLQAADYLGTLERIQLEREVVRSLVSGCRAMVAGYTTKHELFNAEFSAGIENVAFDALEGLSSAMFLRTVKLKDYPWNGSLSLGIAARPDAAWNPIGGFTDPFGRLAWYAIADPALVPSPYEAAWTLNRISDVDISPRQ